MKIRSGFISNSSASSFIVAFKIIPHSVDDILKLLFDNKKDDIFYKVPEEGDHDEIVFTNEHAAVLIFEQIKSQAPLKYNDMRNFVEWIIDQSKDKSKFYNKITGDFELYKYMPSVTRKACTFLNKFLQEHADNYYFSFTFGTDIGLLSGIIEDNLSIFNKFPALYMDR
jgi:hypothetical protein